MIKILLAVALALSLGASIEAQQTQQTAQQFNVAPINQAPNVTNAIAVSDFEANSTTRFYWIITHLAGVASTPVQTSDTKGPVTLSNSSGRRITITWNSPNPSATFDVLETATTTLPLVVNCSCAVQTGITGTSVIDIGTYSSYNTAFPQGFSWNINQSYGSNAPSLNFVYNGTSVCSITAGSGFACGGVPVGPGGANTDVQYNNAGAFGGDSGLTWNKTTGSFVSTGGASATTELQVGTSGANVVELLEPGVLIEAFEPSGIVDLFSAGETHIESAGGKVLIDGGTEVDIQSVPGGALGFFGTVAIAQPTVTGAGTGASLTNLLTALANLGLIINNSTSGSGPTVFINQALGADVPVSATTTTTVMTQAVTMPASGCPCRPFINYSLYVTTASSGVGYSAWISDGTVNFSGSNQGQSNGSSGGLTELQWSGFYPATYANNAVVTFTLKTEGDHTYTVKAASQLAGSAPNSSMQISVN